MNSKRLVAGLFRQFVLFFVIFKGIGASASDPSSQNRTRPMIFDANKSKAQPKISFDLRLLSRGFGEFLILSRDPVKLGVGNQDSSIFRLIEQRSNLSTPESSTENNTNSGD